ncbi:hypothetical protein VST7929_01581 [Vibrio stylophorae]|uniref:FAD-binding oxidoreductase n=1 Tax=Vibrio stylophorae TaxID=659351 RepID=A0ABM8ZTR5_9VIBR|nr:FAD-binding and (Fe-S)-binding domain-containing protein [Vibrio stylophorae]CAH0533706.1 hypothetical protein VST7929_01581 [Vibrio stylophorae]
MLPALTKQHSVNATVLAYLDELKNQGFAGDIETSYGARLAVATDNSVYQVLPQAVLHPKNTADLVLIGRLGQKQAYTAIQFSPRGGGTGTNGQALTSGVVVDLSRHMNRVLEINIEQGWARVQTGVIKDQLNDALRPYGYFFSPELSTSNRATIGGMINTDASGQGSLAYGKTSDHVLGLTAVLVDGSVLETEKVAASQIDALSNKEGLAGGAVATTAQVCRDKRQQILDKFPPLNRFLTGYDLKHVFNDDLSEFDLTRILCGSEGSLAFLTEAKLNITPIPKVRTLINVKYDSFDSALRNAPVMVAASALSVETIDSKVLNLAQQDMVWHTVKDLLTDVPGKEMLGINIVEFAGQDKAEIDAKVASLCQTLDALIADESAGVIGYQLTDDLASIGKIYGMRKKAVGLLGAAKGAAKPVAFTEDTCVPPENLADFIGEFRTLLDSHQLAYGMFGHVDAGVLHVRPALDLCDPEQERLMQTISDQVVALVAKYGGLMWGEHGKGFRSEYGPEFFGDELFTELRRIKASFDPHNRLNPGKICTPLGSEAALVKVSDKKRGAFDRQIPVQTRDSFRAAMECNGNGLCFNYDSASPMCPSLKISWDRRQSPKGRAGLVREWLRQLSEQGVDILAIEQKLMDKTPSMLTLVSKVKNSLLKSKQYDFSHEVMDAMQGCLACKACASQCPIKVDVPSFRARFIQLYHTRYLRPAKDHLVANIETLLPIMGAMPRLVNLATQPKIAQIATKALVGYVDTPKLSVPTLKQQLKDEHASRFDLQWLEALSENERQDYMLIVQDPFTTYYDADVVADFVQLAKSLNKKPLVVPFKPNGKAQHIKGFLRRFAKTAQSASDFLNRLATLNIPMVGVDPALVLCYRDEYNEVLGDKRGDFVVQTAHEWLLDVLNDSNAYAPRSDQNPWYLLAHCTEKTKLPNAEKEWGQIFTHFGACLQSVPVGCCGMAGTFGHEADKFEASKQVYQLSWQPRLEELPKDRVMVTGYSCRSQVKRFEKVKVQHPVQVLAKLLRKD